MHCNASSPLFLCASTIKVTPSPTNKTFFPFIPRLTPEGTSKHFNRYFCTIHKYNKFWNFLLDKSMYNRFQLYIFRFKSIANCKLSKKQTRSYSGNIYSLFVILNQILLHTFCVFLRTVFIQNLRVSHDNQKLFCIDKNHMRLYRFASEIMLHQYQTSNSIDIEVIFIYFKLKFEKHFELNGRSSPFYCFGRIEETPGIFVPRCFQLITTNFVSTFFI